MTPLKSRLGIGLAALVVAPVVLAGTDPYFNPLTQSSAVASPNHINELNSPWQVPAGMTQVNLFSMSSVEADANQSVQRARNAGNVASMFDMIAYDPSGNYLFIPHETPWGAGVSRFNIPEGINELLFVGDQEASTDSDCETDALEPRGPQSPCPRWDHDYAAFDPARWTPNGTVVLGEEWSGLGRLVEIMDPMAPAPASPVASDLEIGTDYRELDSIAKVAHEGINFSRKYQNQVIYFIDEWNSGSIYVLVLNTPGDYAGGGTTYVLSVDQFVPSGGDPTALWNEAPNDTATRFGLATWIPLTDSQGNPLEGITDPFRNGPTNDPRENDDTRGGRVAADDAAATPYGRPEDMEVGLLPNFNEILYVTTTSENSVISIEILGNGRAMVRQFVTPETPTNLGFPATTGVINSPDNLAQDALGNIYIIEDAPNSNDVGGDIWFVRDTNSDGVGESIDHFMSLQVAGSESTGLIFNPVNPTRFVMAVQHPTSTDLDEVPDGFGDAVWEFDIGSVVPPPCDSSTGPGPTFGEAASTSSETCTSGTGGFNDRMAKSSAVPTRSVAVKTYGERTPSRKTAVQEDPRKVFGGN